MTTALELVRAFSARRRACVQRCCVCLGCLLSCWSALSLHAQQSPRRVEGYRGIWFSLGQFYGPGSEGEPYSAASRKPVFPYGDKYSGGLGTYTAKHTPTAIFCPEVNKTFFVYGGTTTAEERYLLCMISYYDHALHRVPQPVVLHDKRGVNDPHDNPSLAVDSDGHLWVFVSGRGRTRSGFKYRSVQPYRIDQFELVAEEELTYPQPHFVADQGFLHLFTKYTGVRELYWETSRDGWDWGEDQKLAGLREPGHTRGGHYQTSAVHGTRTGTFFNRHPNGNVDRRTDLYYLETGDNGQSWMTVDGRKVETPVRNVASPSRVMDGVAEGVNVYLKDMAFDAAGRPALLYLTSRGHQPGPPNDPREFRLVRWDGHRWRTSTICAADHNYDMGSLFIGSQPWRVIVPSLPGPQPYHAGGEICVWQSRDEGVSWSKEQQVTGGSPRNHNYARRVLRGQDPFAVFWADGDPTQIGPSHLYFANRDGTRVWRLPYEMLGEYAEPELLPPLN